MLCASENVIKNCNNYQPMQGSECSRVPKSLGFSIFKYQIKFEKNPKNHYITLYTKKQFFIRERSLVTGRGCVFQVADRSEFCAPPLNPSQNSVHLVSVTLPSLLVTQSVTCYCNFRGLSVDTSKNSQYTLQTSTTPLLYIYYTLNNDM